MEEEKEISCEVVRMDLNELYERIELLSAEEKAQLAQRLIGNTGLTVILGSNNVINSSFAIQINKGADEISQQLRELPTEALQELIRAIAIRIAKDGG